MVRKSQNVCSKKYHSKPFLSIQQFKSQSLCYLVKPGYFLLKNDIGYRFGARRVWRPSSTLSLLSKTVENENFN